MRVVGCPTFACHVTVVGVVWVIICACNGADIWEKDGSVWEKDVGNWGVEKVHPAVDCKVVFPVNVIKDGFVTEAT